VKFTFDRFLAETGNAARYLLESVNRIEVVDRYTMKFLLKEPYVWLVEVLANPIMWIIAPEVVQQFGDLKRAESAIGTGPFLLERYEPNVKTVFKRYPDYFRQGQPYVDGVEWVVVEDASAALAMYRSGQLDCGPASWCSVRQEALQSVHKTHPHLKFQDFLSTILCVPLLRGLHRLLVPICEELCSQHHLRLWRSLRRVVAESIEAGQTTAETIPHAGTWSAHELARL
jgi:ABC-type oligopeptide transport system substrate-binding subunit